MKEQVEIIYSILKNHTHKVWINSWRDYIEADYNELIKISNEVATALRKNKKVKEEYSDDNNSHI